MSDPNNLTFLMNLTSNVSTTNNLINTRDDLIVVSIWTMMLLYALVANCIVVAGIFRNQGMRTATSYWFIINLAICDLIMIVISLVHIVPATYWHDDYVEVVSVPNIIAIFFYDLFWYTGVLKLGCMAFNRFVSIIYPMDYKRIFSPQRTLLIIGALYLTGLAVSVPTLFPCCHTLYNHEYWVTVYEPMDTWYYLIDLAVNTVSVLAMVVCYAAIVWKVHSNQRALAKYKEANHTKTQQSNTLQPASTSEMIEKDRESNVQANGNGSNADALSRRNTAMRPHMSRREFRLFVQFFVVSVVFLLTWSTWQWLPRIHFGDLYTTKWIYFLLTSFFFLNNSVNPTVYLLFNTTLRQEVRAMFAQLCNTICCCQWTIFRRLVTATTQMTRTPSSASQLHGSNKTTTGAGSGGRQALVPMNSHQPPSSSNSDDLALDTGAKRRSKSVIMFRRLWARHSSKKKRQIGGTNEANDVHHPEQNVPMLLTPNYPAPSPEVHRRAPRQLLTDRTSLTSADEPQIQSDDVSQENKVDVEITVDEDDDSSEFIVCLSSNV